MKPLQRDMTRCYGNHCDEALTCARYETMEVDDRDGFYSFAANLCSIVEGVPKIFKIEVEK